MRNHLFLTVPSNRFITLNATTFVFVAMIKHLKMLVIMKAKKQIAIT